MSALRAAFVAVVVLPSLLTAQTIPVAPGTKVRVTAPSLELERAVATVAAVRGDTLALVIPTYRIVLSRLVPDTLRPLVPLRAITQLETVTRRASNIGRGALYGGIVGLGLGLVVGAAASSDCSGFGCGDASEIPMAMAGSAILGAGVGFLIGAAGHHDVWGPVPLPPRAPPVTLHLGHASLGGETVGVGVMLRF